MPKRNKKYSTQKETKKPKQNKTKKRKRNKQQMGQIESKYWDDKFKPNSPMFYQLCMII